MKNKIIVLMLAVCMIFAGCSSHKNLATEKAASTNSESEIAIADSKEEIQEENIDVDAPWRKAYIDYLKTDEDVAEYGPGDYGFTFTLIYLDNDDIPELFIDTGVEAGGQFIVTYYDGEVIEEHFSRIGSQYIEKSGLVYTNTGHMDYYPLTITKLENGKFSAIGSGISYVTEEDWEKMREDENYPYTLTYEWEDESVTEDQFNSKVAELYDLEQSKYPDNFYTYDEFLNVIETGKWFSYDHKYEFITGDMTWEEAQNICKEKGGYLATVTCLDEAKTIAEQMNVQGFADYSMYVGYRSCEWVGDECYSFRWINGDGTYQNIMPAMYDFWDYNWPGYDYQDNEWSFENGEQECGLAKYNKETGLIYIFDAPSNLTKVSPEYTGKMGCICEYD